MECFVTGNPNKRLFEGAKLVVAPEARNPSQV